MGEPAADRPSTAGLAQRLVMPRETAWPDAARRFEAVSAAGPASDALLGATFALCCLAVDPGAGPPFLERMRRRPHDP